MEYNLVFEGGGAKGLVFAGALQEFEARGHTFRRVLGTSAGAITASLLAAGYNTAELLEATSEKTADGKPRFASFMDVAKRFAKDVIDDSLTYSIFGKIDLPLIPDWLEEQIDRKITELLLTLPAYRQVFSFIERGGLYAGDEFIVWLKEKLNANGRNLAEATLAEMFAQTNIDLTVVGSDTEGAEMLVLNHRTAPDLPVAYAVRMSMSIPFLWHEVKWKSEWGTYRGKDITGHSIVDGGVLSNFPIELLISKSEEVKAVMGSHDGLFALGFLIDESIPVPDAPEVKIETEETSKLPKIDFKQLQTVKRIMKLMDTLTMARDKQVIDAYKDGVCRLPAKGYGTTEFDMTDERREKLIQAGQTTAQAFFDRLAQL